MRRKGRAEQQRNTVFPSFLLLWLLWFLSRTCSITLPRYTTSVFSSQVCLLVCLSCFLSFFLSCCLLLWLSLQLVLRLFLSFFLLFFFCLFLCVCVLSVCLSSYYQSRSQFSSLFILLHTQTDRLRHAIRQVESDKRRQTETRCLSCFHFLFSFPRIWLVACVRVSLSLSLCLSYCLTVCLSLSTHIAFHSPLCFASVPIAITSSSSFCFKHVLFFLLFVCCVFRYKHRRACVCVFRFPSSSAYVSFPSTLWLSLFVMRRSASSPKRDGDHSTNKEYTSAAVGLT